MTVQEVIVKNNIGDFSLTFTNVLGIRIENPNPNIIADMTAKSVEIDWVSQSAKISVVTRQCGYNEKIFNTAEFYAIATTRMATFQ